MGIQIRLSPFGTGPLRSRIPSDEIMQHSAVVEDEVPLVEPVPEGFGIGEDFTAPSNKGRTDLFMKLGCGNGIYHCFTVRARERDPLVPDDPADENHVAVVGANQ